MNFIIGYAEIEIEGYYIERFINTCLNRGILLWGINRKLTTVLVANVSLEEFEKLEEIAKKNQCIVSVKDKKGLPILWKKYKKRKAFVISLVVLLLNLLILSRFVWNIEIIGNDKIDSNEILQEVKANGLKIGMLKSKINTESIINKIRLDRDDLAWIGIELKGTNALVKVVEADKKPEIVDENDYCNIVATKDGEISKIYARNGTSLVHEGDLVKKGDVLIAGYMEGNYTGRQYVNADGVVKAKIKYQKTTKIDKKEIKREKTGKKENKISIKINNFKINFFKRLSKFEKYDTIYTEKKLQLFPNFYLPVTFVQSNNFEINETEVIHTADDAKIEAENKISSEVEANIEGNIVNKITDVAEYDSYYNITVTYEAIEEIGTKEKIDF